MTPFCEVEQICIVNNEDDKCYYLGHLDLEPRYSIDSSWCRMTVNSCSAWAMQPPDVCGHNWLSLTMISNVDWNSDDEFLLFRLIPHSLWYHTERRLSASRVNIGVGHSQTPSCPRIPAQPAGERRGVQAK
eukprot:2602962-Pyramimonas_sp.AAC.1